MIPKEALEICENAPTVYRGNVDHFGEILKVKDVDIAERPHDEQCSGRQTSFKDLTKIYWKLLKSIGKKYFDVAVEGERKH